MQFLNALYASEEVNVNLPKKIIPPKLYIIAIDLLEWVISDLQIGCVITR